MQFCTLGKFVPLCNFVGLCKFDSYPFECVQDKLSGLMLANDPRLITKLEGYAVIKIAKGVKKAELLQPVFPAKRILVISLQSVSVTVERGM